MRLSFFGNLSKDSDIKRKRKCKQIDQIKSTKIENFTIISNKSKNENKLKRLIYNCIRVKTVNRINSK